MPRRSVLGFGRNCVVACALVVLPRLAWAAPPVDTFPPIDIPPTPERTPPSEPPLSEPPLSEPPIEPPVEPVDSPAPIDAPLTST